MPPVGEDSPFRVEMNVEKYMDNLWQKVMQRVFCANSRILPTMDGLFQIFNGTLFTKNSPLFTHNTPVSTPIWG
jgi:hypothetical protein